MACPKPFPWLKVLRILGILSAMTIIALGVYQIIADSPTIKGIVGNIYRIIFGLLIIIAEFQYVRVLDWFSFLCTLCGLGGFYIFVGGLALGSEWYAVTIAVIVVFVGLSYCVSGLACTDDRDTAVAVKNGGTGAAAGGKEGGWKDPDHGQSAL